MKSFVRNFSNIAYTDKETKKAVTFNDIAKDLQYIDLKQETERRVVAPIIADFEKQLSQAQSYDQALRIMSKYVLALNSFWRDYNRLGHSTATEHTMYSTTSKLWAFAEKDRDLGAKGKDGTPWDEGFTPYEFKDDVTSAERGSTKSIHVEHWDGYSEYFVDWIYDKTANEYSRKNGGVPHLDKNTGKQLTAKNIVILYQKESSANDGYENNVHLLYKTTGSGKALIFLDGKAQEGKWVKTKEFLGKGEATKSIEKSII